jgi:phage virion morphogenesis protein
MPPASNGFTVTIDDRAVQAALTRLARQVADMTPVMEDIGRALGKLTEDAFQAEGPGWPALSPVTVARRGGAHPILQDSGGLAASITHGGNRRSAWVGASKVYAAVQQFGQKKGASGRTRRGAPIPWGDIPPRPYLPIDESGALTPAARDEVLAILADALRAAL